MCEVIGHTEGLNENVRYMYLLLVYVLITKSEWNKKEIRVAATL